tara:strand:- start:7659 stop:8978 length:1320 start_codon:yes stop_codon:yes gene_type:complete
MTPRQFKTVKRGGQDVLRVRPAWLSYWGSFLAAMGVIGLWIVQRPLFDGMADALGLSNDVAGLGLAIGLLPIAIRVFYHRYTHAYEIENGRKLRLVAGFISRVKREFPLTDKVQTDMGQSFIGRILNYGTLAFWTGDDRSRLTWKDAPDPDRIVAFLDRLKSGGPSASHQRSDAPRMDATSTGDGDARRIPESPTLKEAKSSKYTHFGRAPEYKQVSEMIAKRIKTPLGNYIDNDDGTVTDERGGLMWLRAPWGMVWTGAGFAGEPIDLKWEAAADLFGRGADVGYNVGSTMAYMGHEKRRASAFSNEYKSGSCVVHAAGYKDWRLPTAEEIDRLSPYIHSNSNDAGRKDHNLSQDDTYDWQWHGKTARSVFQRLYPELSAMKSYLWTANGLGGGLAWAFDGGLPVGDFKVSDERPVLFVRKITGGEVKAPKMEDEEIQ